MARNHCQLAPACSHTRCLHHLNAKYQECILFYIVADSVNYILAVQHNYIPLLARISQANQSICCYTTYQHLSVIVYLHHPVCLVFYDLAIIPFLPAYYLSVSLSAPMPPLVCIQSFVTIELHVIHPLKLTLTGFSVAPNTT